MAGSASGPAGPCLVIDGGKSKTDALIVNERGTRLAESTGPGLESIASRNGPELMEASLSETLASFGTSMSFDTVCFGLNGVFAPSPNAMLAMEILKRLVCSRRYIVASDIVMTYVGALGIRAGVVVAAGTGAVVLALGRDGRARRVDGHGPLFADRGSGYDVGRRGIEDAVRAADGVGDSPALLGQLERRFGTVDGAVKAIYGSMNPAQVVASFSRNVAVAAADGDARSRKIWWQAGVELACSVKAAAVAAGLPSSPYAVSSAGGLFKAGALVQVPFEEELRRVAPGARYRPGLGGALEGGISLALRPDPVLTDITVWVASS